MWSRYFLSFCIVLIISCISCHRTCDRETKQHALEQRQEAFRKWESSLDFMDQELITGTASDLLSSLDQSAECIPFDDNIPAYVDSVSAWHIALSPSTSQLQKAQAYTDSVKTGIWPVKR